MDIAIRTATASDAADICTVIRRSIGECCVKDHQNNPAALAAWLENKTSENVAAWVQTPGAVAVVSVENGVIVGFALSVVDQLILCYVAPEALYQGAGKALLRAIESRVLPRGIQALRLESTRTAQAFYTRNGFTASGPVQVWAGMESLPMTKDLTVNFTLTGMGSPVVNQPQP